MGETRDWLEQNGGPGQVYCLSADIWTAARCKGCKNYCENQGYEVEQCVEFDSLPELSMEDLAHGG